MSDGWDDSSAYGHVHRLPLPGEAGGGLSSLRLVARNSGLFYLAATRQCLLTSMLTSPLTSLLTNQRTSLLTSLLHLFTKLLRACPSTYLQPYRQCLRLTKILADRMAHEQVSK